MSKIKVMVVDDSAFMRKAIKQLLEDTGKIEVVDTARDGKDAVEKAKTTEADVITMDVEMPVMDGLHATKEIMKSVSPVPIVMLSSVTHEGAEATILALEYGAVDFILKPSGNISLDIDKIAREIVDKIEAAASSKVARMRKIKIDDKVKEEKIIKLRTDAKKVKPEILMIGTSTGGPQALQNIIPKLPMLGIPVIVVQHMPKGFTKSLANSLNAKSEMTVKELEFGEELKANFVYICPGGDKHSVVENRIGRRFFKEKDNLIDKKFYIPSVDVMMKSLVPIYKEKILGVILTGMGNDGLEGFRDMKSVGAYAIAESEKTAVVYGMPRVVVEAGLADDVQPVQNVAEVIVKRINTYR